jgi:hypothetical protein
MGRAVSPHTLRWIWALSTVFVISLISVIALWADGSAVRFISLSGLLLLTPMALFSALALSVAPFLRRVAAATFFALNIASAGALFLAWRSAPYSEDGFVFVLYIAVSVMILVISFVLALRMPRRRL